MIFRIIGLLLIMVSFVLWIPLFLVNLSAVNPFFTLFSVLPFLVLGIILYILSKFLAKLVCLDFNNFND